MTAAKELEAKFTGITPISSWNPHEALSPQRVWASARSVITVGIPDIPTTALPHSREFGAWDVKIAIMDKIAYELALFLTGKGYPSVNLPAAADGSSNEEYQSMGYPAVLVFDHEKAARLAGFGKAGANGPLNETNGPEVSSCWLFASVLTAWKLEESV